MAQLASSVPVAWRVGGQRQQHRDCPQDQALPWLKDWQGPGSIPCHNGEWGQQWGEPTAPPTTRLFSGFLPGTVWIWPFLFGGGGKKAQAKAPSNRRYQNKELMLINS